MNKILGTICGIIVLVAILVGTALHGVEDEEEDES